jgi:hypothetical protein
LTGESGEGIIHVRARKWGLPMPIDMPAYMALRRKFLANRAVFPTSELAKHAGRWIAWSPDGSRIAASAIDPELLDEMLRKIGENPAECIIECMPDDGEFCDQADGSAA